MAEVHPAREKLGYFSNQRKICGTGTTKLGLPELNDD